MQTYHLFISHSWNYSDAHDNLVRLLNAKLLLTDTRLPVPTVAALSGFASQRSFHAAQAETRIMMPPARPTAGATSIRLNSAGANRFARHIELQPTIMRARASAFSAA